MTPNWRFRKWPILVLSVVLVEFCHQPFVEGQNRIQDVASKSASNISEPSLCSIYELNHSNLVECDNLGCIGADFSPIWPEATTAGEKADIIHVYSSRSGDRFAVDRLKNLNYMETQDQRNFDINTTLQVTTNRTRVMLHGFGTIVNLDNLANLSPDIHKNVLRELFDESRLGLSMMMIRTSKVYILNGTLTEYFKQFANLYPTVNNLMSKDTIRLFISIDDLQNSREIIEVLSELQNIPNCSTKLWAVVLDDSMIKENLEWRYMKDIFGRVKAFISSHASNPLESYLKLGLTDTIYNGLLLKWKYSIPYNTIEAFRATMKKDPIVTLSSEGLYTDEPGDWQNAQNYAVQILNHLKHGSNGFIDNQPMIDVFSKRFFQDGLIYGLYQNDGLYFRGPMYYALGHISRYVVPGSTLLETLIETQPNMFAAQYAAFETPNEHIVVIALNDNEHILPFRVRWKNRVVVMCNLKPKSFNTIIIRM